ncbi:MAG: glycoside hydrolase family 3 C-terminal domain-containing protein [Oscillospiraceae bacterium]|nr:glycoside hydrolase family 3 C-terminal domain-containing protein [Oscillospiraceae bacterium]
MNIKDLVSKMTLEEKAGLCSGSDFWHTKAVERLGIPAVMVSDGPHGLRKQDLNADHLGVNISIEAVCFPAACALACSFDRELIYKMGQALGNECQAEDVSVILGPGANIKRSPVCGRNFEYFSEDPYLSSQMAANHIKGVQSQNVGTSLKHFAANNQEHRRMSASSEIDERTLREIYLASFETAVKEAKPWTVMCSYNRVNGVYASENKKLLTDILRDEWGFDGFVVSDWGAVDERVEGLKAGLDLEMPSSGGFNDELIVKAVRDGSLDEKVLDRAVERILGVIDRYLENRNKNAVWDKEKDSRLAREIERECIVLLKNDDSILPLSKTEKVAFIGEFAEKPRYQGGGSSHINSFDSLSALDAVKGVADVEYARGYDSSADVTDKNLIAEAVSLAERSDKAVIFAGLPDSFESEGFDRSHMRMPENQNKLIAEVCKVQPNTVVVLHNGSPVEMPWVNDVKGIVEVYLGGQSVGGAETDILFGDANPCGKLAETFPKKLSDNPSYLSFPGEGDKTVYSEGIFVGYRYYDKKEMDVLFPFGHGLSYTQFEYSNLKLSADRITDNDTLKVTVDVKNVGNVSGKEIVQLYVSDRESRVIRPLKELKGFEKLSLEPGEQKTAEFVLDKRSFAYYNTEISDWHVESGEFDIMVGKSSRDIVLTDTVYVDSTVKLPVHYTMNTTFGDMLEDEDARAYTDRYIEIYREQMSGNDEGNEMGESTGAMIEAMLKYNPMRAMVSFSGGKISVEEIKEAIEKLNNR